MARNRITGQKAAFPAPLTAGAAAFALLSALAAGSAAQTPPAAAQAPATPAAVAAPSAPPAIGGDTPATDEKTGRPAEKEEKNSDPQEKKESVQTPDWRGSLMFSLKDLERLHQMLEAFENKTIFEIEGEGGEDQAKDFLSTITDKEKATAPKPAPYVFPSFYLSSILYASPTEWTLWINNRKIDASGKFKDDYLTVEHISKNEARLLWTPPSADMASLTPAWKAKMDQTASGKTQLPATVAYVPGEDSIRFTLRPNQSFSAKDMTIIEGRPPAPKRAPAPPIAEAPAPTAETAPGTPPGTPGAATQTEAAMDEVSRKALESGIDLGPLMGPLKAISKQTQPK